MSYGSVAESTVTLNHIKITTKVAVARGDVGTVYVRIYAKYNNGLNGYYTRDDVYYFITRGSTANHNYVYIHKDVLSERNAGESVYYYYKGSDTEFTGVGYDSFSINAGVSTSASSQGSGVAAKVSRTVPGRKTYTVAFNANGAPSGTSVPNSLLHISGTTDLIPTMQPAWTGHTFLGWNTAANGSETSYAPGAAYSANASATLYAIWSINTYTISYSGNATNVSGVPESQTKNYGASITLSNTRPTRPGYSFLNWNTVANGSGTTYQPGDTYSTNANLTLYAQWATVVYTVTLNDAGSITQLTKAAGASVMLPALSKTGYNFLGWDTSSAAATAVYAPGATYSTDASITLYAVWQKADLPIYIEVNGVVHKIEKAYIKINGTVKDCDVYIKINGSVIKLE